ncbi:hypothetical protein F5141DRAFT_1063394 [Pisolithus sp. B1]|nr:hypothetical protein F5141DRAFT_1063394 [Pisolithus sp. B1]
MPSHHDELLNLPSQEPLHNEGSFRDAIPTALTSGPRGSAVQQNLKQASCYPTTNAIAIPSTTYLCWPISYQQSNTSLMVPPVVELQHGQEHTQDAQACSVSLAGAHSTKPCESPQEWPEVMVLLPMAGATESGGGVRTIHHNLPPYLPIQHPHLQSRIYPGTSKAESTILSSAASARLLAVEEGYIGISPGERGMEPEPPAGESPGELYLEIISSRMYSRDDQFSYDRIPYHPSMNPRWYDPSHRGSEHKGIQAPYQLHSWALKVDSNILQEPAKMLYWIQLTHQLAVILHLPETCEKPKDSLGTGGYQLLDFHHQMASWLWKLVPSHRGKDTYL